MLTGDKLETAENIARSCNLVEPDMKVHYIQDNTAEDVEKTLNKCCADNKNYIKNKDRKCIIIEGNSLRFI